MRCRRLARRAGIGRIQSTIYQEIRNVVKQKLEDVSLTPISAACEGANKQPQSLSTVDVVLQSFSSTYSRTDIDTDTDTDTGPRLSADWLLFWAIPVILPGQTDPWEMSPRVADRYVIEYFSPRFDLEWQTDYLSSNVTD
jgi:hypothetical protein